MVDRALPRGRIRHTSSKLGVATILAIGNMTFEDVALSTAAALMLAARGVSDYHQEHVRSIALR
jgi:hypothetical protein